VSDVQSVGGKVTVDKLDKVDIMSVRAPRKPEYAEPASTR
jgi:hypothetical protein